MDQHHKPRHLKALLKLSRASGCYPECLALKGVEMEAHPVAAGSYGEVYRGLLQKKQIAVKVLKVYQDSDFVQLLKVAFRYRPLYISNLTNAYSNLRPRLYYGGSFPILMFWPSMGFIIWTMRR
jgi:hypothetical protein